MTKKALGLIVNPVAGLGGRVGLKGSDGLGIQQQARALGAVPQASNRACEALERLAGLRATTDILTYPAEMGEDAARASGFEPIIIGSIESSQTTGQDTQRAAQAMRDYNADIILFTGGDGTARDVYAAIADTLPVLGIPAGVKIHSAAFAVNPASAGELAASFLQGEVSSLREAEVMDLDEDAFRQGIVSPQLYGYLKVPYLRRLVQARKAPTRPDERGILDAIATYIIDHMQDGIMYIVGPGTTTRPILSLLGLEKTLIGVDVLRNKQLLAVDANEATLLSLLSDHRAEIIVTPIGGQGFIFGRGNQQISPEVIAQVGRDNITVISTVDKIASLHGSPLQVDTGNQAVDEMLRGYIRVITGYNEQIVYRVS